MAQLKSTVVQGNLSVTDGSYLNGQTILGGHLILPGVTSGSTANTTQIIFKNGSTEYGAISATTSNQIILNPSSSSTTGQIILTPNGTSKFTSTTASSSKTTGALVVSGGVGVGGTVYANEFNGPLTGHASSDLALSGGTMTGPIYFGITSMDSAILGFSSTYPKYGIWYKDAATDTMRLSASGNADTDAGADLCINGAGDGTVTIRGVQIVTNTGTWGINTTGNAATATVLYTGGPTSSTSGDIAGAIQAYWNANKSTIPRNKGLALYSTHSTASMSFGYFLSGYDSTPYGGFFSALYGTPYYIGVNQGTFTQQTILTSTNYTTYCTPANIGAATSGHNHDSVYLKLSGGTMTGTLTLAKDKWQSNSTYGLHANNSDVIGVNSLRFADSAETFAEGIMFPNGTSFDCIAPSSGTFFFRAATDGSPSLSVANSTAQIACGGLIINQPAAARNKGVIGTYDSTKAALIWSMGSSYNIAADGSGLSNLYGAAYGYQGQAYLGSNNYAGGHQFLWCQNGAVNVALGTGIWSSGNILSIGTGEHFVEAQNTTTSCRILIASSSDRHGVWSNGYWNGSAYTAGGKWLLYRYTDNFTHFGDSTITHGNSYINGDLYVRQSTSPWPSICFGTQAQTNTYTMSATNSWAQIYYQASAKRNSDNNWYAPRMAFREFSYTASSTTRLSTYEDYCLPYVNAGLGSSIAYNILTSKGFTGINSSWNTARNNAQLRLTTIYTGGYSPILSVKTTNGSWEMGEYDNTNFSNYLLFTYVTDTQYNTSGANYTTQLRLNPNGYAMYARSGEAGFQAANLTSGVTAYLLSGGSGLAGLYCNGYNTNATSPSTSTFVSSAGWILARDTQGHNSLYGTICVRSAGAYSIIYGKGTIQSLVNGYFGLCWDDLGSGNYAKFSANRFRALYYSYNSSTNVRLNTYEYYDLPAVTANLGASMGYSIITTKNASDLFRVVGWTCSYTISANSDIHLTQSDFGITTQTAKNKGVDPDQWQPVAFTRIATSSSNLITSTFWASCAQPGTGASGSGTYASNSTVVVIRNVSSTAYGPSNTRTCTIYLLYIRKTASNVGYLYSNV